MRGLEYAWEKKDHCQLEPSVAELDKWQRTYTMTIASLQEQVASLTTSLDAYLILRNRFLSTYKKDKLHNATDADFRMIAAGNKWAHGGDAVADARLYQGQVRGRRRDFATYQSLYGITPAETSEIGKVVIKVFWNSN